MLLLYLFVKFPTGIDTENSYPYKAKRSRRCHFDPAIVGATDNKVVMLRRGDESVLKEAVSTVGPISAAIDARSRPFNDNSSVTILHLEESLLGL